jgi:hypothetical protein
MTPTIVRKASGNVLCDSSVLVGKVLVLEESHSTLTQTFSVQKLLDDLLDLNLPDVSAASN